MLTENISISKLVEIPLTAISFRFSRSSGPGGQNVNRVESRVELLFDLAGSPALTEEQRQILQERLASHLDKNGILHLSVQIHRSQLKNREEALLQFQRLLTSALKPRKKRRPTRPSKASRERRLELKKIRGRSKRSRKKIELE